MLENIIKSSPHRRQILLPPSLCTQATLTVCLQVYYWREHKHNSHHMEKHILNFSGNHTRGMLPGLHPFSLYAFNVRVYNGKGEGPPSPTNQFETPEGGEDKEGLCLSAPVF